MMWNHFWERGLGHGVRVRVFFIVFFIGSIAIDVQRSLVVGAWYPEVAGSARACALPGPAEEVAHSLSQWRQVSDIFEALLQKHHRDYQVDYEDGR